MQTTHKRSIPCLPGLPRPLYNRHETLAQGSWTEEHSHPWCQLSYAARGVLGVRTPSFDHAAPPHHAVWIPPDVPHQVVNRREAEMRSLYLSREAAAGLPSESCILEISPLIRELIRRIGELPVEYDEEGPAGRLVAVLVDELAAARRAPFGLPLPADRRLVAICSALEQAPDDDRTLNEWAASAGASARTLARLFVKETGLGFGEWRQRLRLLLSLDALEAGESVTRVALAHGYNSTSAFIAAFRGIFGASPGELRDKSPS